MPSLLMALLERYIHMYIIRQSEGFGAVNSHQMIFAG
jgi:hypothetical protein